MNGLVYAGGSPRPDARAAELARALGWPLLAEPTSGLSGLAAGEALLGDVDFQAAHAPEAVVRFGSMPTTRAALTAIGRARAIQPAEAEPAAGGWLDGWQRASDAARAAMDGFLDALEEPFEVRVARDTAAAVPAGAILLVGSSTPVRDLCLGMRPRSDIRVLANRGASGIDGFVSTAFGAAWSGARTVALCGDLTLLHDAGALLWGARRGREVIFVVPDNDGGGIFDLLPSASLPENDAFFVTPHGLDLGAVARAAGAAHERTGDVTGALQDALRGGGGVTIIEVPIERARALELRAALRAAIGAAVRGALAG